VPESSHSYASEVTNPRLNQPILIFGIPRSLLNLRLKYTYSWTPGQAVLTNLTNIYTMRRTHIGPSHHKQVGEIGGAVHTFLPKPKITPKSACLDPLPPPILGLPPIPPSLQYEARGAVAPSSSKPLILKSQAPNVSSGSTTSVSHFDFPFSSFLSIFPSFLDVSTDMCPGP
jgi:hypothetical protein